MGAVFLLYLLSTLMGVSAITWTIAIYQTYKKEIVAHFLFLLISLFLIQVGLLLNVCYEISTKKDLVILIFQKIFDVGGSAVFIMAGPIIILKLSNIKMKRNKYVLLIAPISFILSYSVSFIGGFEFSKNISKSIMNLTIIFVVSMFLINFHNIGDTKLKKKLKKYLILAAIFVPLFLLESVRENIKIIKELRIIEVLSLPMFLIVVNIFNILLGKEYMNTPSNIEISKNILTEYFINKYSITEREIEIIQLIREGMTYKEIAEKLFLAYKTVDNHIQAIYKKTGVSSKQQLKSLIEINS